MIRKYRVTVSGHAYEVEVEELGSGGLAVRSAERVQAAAPTESAAPYRAAAPTTSAPEHAAAAAPSSPRPASTSGVVASPLPGKVLGVRAQVGQKVKRGDLLLVIEAMKMENEIFAGEAGTVRKMHVASGQNVETGDLLVELAPGD